MSTPLKENYGVKITFSFNYFTAFSPWENLFFRE